MILTQFKNKSTLGKIVSWWQSYTGKMKQLKYLQEQRNIKEEKTLKVQYFEQYRNIFKKVQDNKLKEKQIQVMLKRKFLTLWTTVYNSQSSQSFS